MRKIVIGGIVLVALGAVAMFFFLSTPELLPNATQCEKDCINDSGGVPYCVKYCKENDHYGPPQQPEKK